MMDRSIYALSQPVLRVPPFGLKLLPRVPPGSAHQPAPLCPRPAPTHHRQAGRVDSQSQSRVVASVVGCCVKWRVAPPSCDEAETQLRVGPRARKPDSRR